jgi:DNA-binding response OmpR family regulator
MPVWSPKITWRSPQHIVLITFGLIKWQNPRKAVSASTGARPRGMEDVADILIIEDNAEIAQLIRLHMEDLGHKTDWQADGTAGLKQAQSKPYDLVVLDLMLPGTDGLSVCRSLRENNARYTPILMLTARASEIDRVVGLETGADDYLGKPFSIAELQARAKALLRRAERMGGNGTATPVANAERLDRGALQIDLKRRIVTLHGQTVALTAKEFDLLLFFAQNPGRVYTRSQLLDAVWNTTLASYEHNVNTHINRLRAKIEADPAQPTFILTVRGIGYRFCD